MKTKIKLFALAVLMTLSYITTANDYETGIKFFKGSFEDALAESRKLNKPIFVDFYADWCGPCRWMARDVFTDEGVGEYFNENFISMQIDAENDELELVEGIDLDAYPTLVFFDSKGEIMLKQVGALDTWELIEKGMQVLDGPEIRARYEANPDNYDALYAYLELVAAEDEHKAQDLVMKYLSDLPKDEWQSARSWELISTYIIDYNSDVMQYVLENDELFAEKFPDYSDFILGSILGKMLEAAVEEENVKLLENAIDLEIRARTITGSLEWEKNYYALESTYIYQYYVGDMDQFFNTYDEWIRTYFWNDQEELIDKLTEFAKEHMSYPDRVMKAMAWGERAIELNDDWRAYFAVSYSHYLIDQYEASIRNARKSIDKVDDEDTRVELESYLDSLIEEAKL